MRFGSILAAACVAAAPALTGAQTTAQRPVNGELSTAKISIDRVEAVDLSLAVQQPASGQGPEPRVGQRATLKFRIKNTGASAAAIPWRVAVGGTTLGEGTHANVAPGATVDVSATWTVTSGSHAITATADPNGAVEESSPARVNNVKHLTVVPRHLRRLLASEAGAASSIFAINTEGPGGACASDFQIFDNNPIFSLSCGGPPTSLPQAPTGWKAKPEIYKGVSLKNGWTVHDVRVFSPNHLVSWRSDHQWLTRPSGASPFGQLSIFIDPLNAAARSRVGVMVETWIIGPSNTSPF